MSLRALLLLLLAVALATAACGGDGGTPTTQVTQQPGGDGGNGGNGGEGEDNGNGSGESDQAPRGGDLPASVPDDFEIPFPAGWEIDIHDEIGLVGSGAQLLYAEDRFDEIVAFYEAWTESRPEDYATTEANELVVFTRMDGTIWTITVSKDEQRDQTWTLLQVTGGSAEVN